MINNVTFGLSSIEDIRCDIDTFIEIKDGELRFQYKISVVINMSKGTITVIPEVQYRTSDEVVLSAFAAFIYDVKDIDDVISLNFMLIYCQYWSTRLSVDYVVLLRHIPKEHLYRNIRCPLSYPKFWSAIPEFRLNNNRRLR